MGISKINLPRMENHLIVEPVVPQKNNFALELKEVVKDAWAGGTWAGTAALTGIGLSELTKTPHSLPSLPAVITQVVTFATLGGVLSAAKGLVNRHWSQMS